MKMSDCGNFQIIKDYGDGFALAVPAPAHFPSRAAVIEVKVAKKDPPKKVAPSKVDTSKK